VTGSRFVCVFFVRAAARLYSKILSLYYPKSAGNVFLYKSLPALCYDTSVVFTALLVFVEFLTSDSQRRLLISYTL